MINNKIVYNSILPQSLTNKGWKLEGYKIGKDGPYQSKFTNGDVSGIVDLSSLSSNVNNPDPDNWNAGDNESRVITKYRFPDGDYDGKSNVIFKISDMILKGCADGDLDLSLNKTGTQCIESIIS